MKTINKLAGIVSFLFACTPLLAQEQPTVQPTPTKRIVVNDFFIQSGMFATQQGLATAVDFRKLAPQSALLKSDLSTYNTAAYPSFHANTMLSVLLGLQFLDKEKKAYKANPLLRLGFSYMKASALSADLTKTFTKPFDTLISSHNNPPTYVDSSTTRTYNMNYSSEQIRLDASLLFRSNPEARWSLFTGFGVTLGASLNAKTDISYNVYQSTSNENTSTSYSGSGNGFGYSFYYNENTSSDVYKTESFRNSNNVGVSAYIPLGVDFRIGKKRPFWKMSHLFLESRPGLNWTSIPELRTVAGACIQLGFGYRAHF
ncbi:MAG: hypothetical protein PSX36_13025 [bacterium]|nr:hypothetical protein [bacterium]